MSAPLEEVRVYAMVDWRVHWRGLTFRHCIISMVPAIIYYLLSTLYPQLPGWGALCLWIGWGGVVFGLHYGNDPEFLLRRADSWFEARSYSAFNCQDVAPFPVTSRDLADTK